ncbi:MAG TPA: tRNA dihydrouridine synthase DusB [Candidatus Saccharimonadales bacterium]|nr:tRNA dihydrouridine synthase DusB [Candidatus Saccharimonadales bacterium]
MTTTAFRPLRVGRLELSSPVLVAPMVGITDAPCRELCRELGAGLVSTEMVAAEAVVRSTDAVLHLLDFPGDVAPVAAQLVGRDPAVMAAAAQVCVERGAVLVDVNLGCPVSKVVSRGSGAALARDVIATARVVAAMVEAVRVPVTVKMRLGWDSSTINAPELARALEDSGVAAVTVHGRTRCQKYEGIADWAQIARVKEAVGIPVFGSGDVEDVETLARRIESGVVDGVVIARGMLGNFWFVRQAVHRLATGTRLADLDFAGRIALARRHLDMLCAYHGDARALRIGRKYVAWTIRGCAGAARLRAEVQTMDTRERLDALLDRALAAGPRPEGWFRPVFISGEG